jgi:GAF domain-containing protein
MIDFLAKILSKRPVHDRQLSNHDSIHQELPAGIKINPVRKFISANNFSNLTLTEYISGCFSLLAKEKEISQGAFYIIDEKDNKPCLRFISGFAIPHPDEVQEFLYLDEGLPGQVAVSGDLINISDIPGDYFMIESGLGKGKPASLIIFPVKHENKVIAIIELSSFCTFTADDQSFFMEISPSIAEQIMKCERIA